LAKELPLNFSHPSSPVWCKPARSSQVNLAAVICDWFFHPIADRVSHTWYADKITGLKISKDGAASADFTITGLHKKPLPPSKSISVNVTFRPTAEGSKQVLLHITSHESLDNPFDLTLIGTDMRAKKPR